MLDPFVPLLSASLTSPHVKVLCRSLHCLVWVLRLPLPSLDDHLEDIAVQLFALLRKYARAGMGVGNNREMVLSAFKVGCCCCCLFVCLFVCLLSLSGHDCHFVVVVVSVRP